MTSSDVTCDIDIDVDGDHDSDSDVIFGWFCIKARIFLGHVTDKYDFYFNKKNTEIYKYKNYQVFFFKIIFAFKKFLIHPIIYPIFKKIFLINYNKKSKFKIATKSLEC